MPARLKALSDNGITAMRLASQRASATVVAELMTLQPAALIRDTSSGSGSPK